MFLPYLIGALAGALVMGAVWFICSRRRVHLIWADNLIPEDVESLRNELERALADPGHVLITNYQVHHEVIARPLRIAPWMWITEIIRHMFSPRSLRSRFSASSTVRTPMPYPTVGSWSDSTAVTNPMVPENPPLVDSNFVRDFEKKLLDELALGVDTSPAKSRFQILLENKQQDN